MSKRRRRPLKKKRGKRLKRKSKAKNRDLEISSSQLTSTTTDSKLTGRLNLLLLVCSLVLAMTRHRMLGSGTTGDSSTMNLKK